ncbi:MAG: DUF2795 domain-containing protein [Armatimonadota bacterium]|nr:DUF2795 domain-containing protein [Armatimonadota bacterium]
MVKGFKAMDAIANVTDSLHGVDFPKSKEDLIEYAKDRNAPDNVIGILERIPDQVYNSMGDLINKIRGVA